MLSFKYKIQKIDGEIQSGKIAASSKVDAISLLKKEEVYILSIEEEKKSALNIKLSLGVPKQNVILFTKQLEIILKSKITLIEALGIITPEIRHLKFQSIIIDIAEKVKSGMPFSSALKSHPKLFGEFYVGLIKMGERSGRLSDSLSSLSKHLDEQQKFKRKIKAAIAYPIFLLIIMILVVGVIFLWIFPEKLIPILEGFGGELPLITTLMIGFVNFLVANIIKILFIFFFFVIAIIIISKIKKGRYFLDNLILKLPILGNLIKKFYIIQFAKNFSVSLSSGLSIVESLKITERIISNTVYKKAIFETREKIITGTSLTYALRAYPSLFSSFFMQMLIVGERTGMQGSSLIGISEIYEEELDQKINLIIKLIEPFIMIILGVIVFVVVLSVFLPIIQITTIQ